MCAPFEPLIRGSRLSDRQARRSLETISRALAQITGFQLVGISGVRDDGFLQVLAIVGPEDARGALQDSLAPADPLLDQLRDAEDWGLLKFVPHDRMRLDLQRWGWIAPLSDQVPDPGHRTRRAWHPENLLVAPVYGERGRLVGVIGLDMPRGGLVPDPDQRAEIGLHLEQACRSIAAILEREQLAEEVRLAKATADIVRQASTSMSADEVLEECGAAIVEGFRAKSLWSQVTGQEPRPVRDANPVPPPRALVELVERFAAAAWADQRVGVFAPDRPPPPPLSARELSQVLTFLEETETNTESMLVVPLGAGREYLGWIALCRGKGASEWSETETAMALDIGRDLGRTLANARTYERERRLVQQLQEVADYKSNLVATVSHELRTPLTSIVGFLEILAGQSDLSERSRRAIEAIQRGSTRLSRVVEELLVLHRAADGELTNAAPLDLAPIVREVAGLHRDAAQQRGISVDLDLPDGPATVLGAAHELEHVVANLIGNAVKYTNPGGSVTVAVRVAADGVLLTCADTGVGIPADEVGRIFEEFYRSSNPAALDRTGSGLGLAIVRTVVERHRGRIEVDSEVGRGTTFEVFLPAPPA